MRRALGYKLARAEKLLGQFLGYLERRGAGHDHDRARARAGRRCRPAASPSWWAQRLSVVRGFAALPARARPGARGPAAGSAAADGRGARSRTSTPTQEIAALMAATRGILRRPLRRRPTGR